jgi:thiaminase/transcriptional activator TenA
MSTPCFTDAAWQRNLPLFNATLALPFNRELAAGTLSRERFQHYMIRMRTTWWPWPQPGRGCRQADDADGGCSSPRRPKRCGRGTRAA